MLFEYLANVGAGTVLGDHVVEEQQGEFDSYLEYTHEGAQLSNSTPEAFRAVPVYIKGHATLESALMG